jgi:hypothetical protein
MKKLLSLSAAVVAVVVKRDPQHPSLKLDHPRRRRVTMKALMKEKMIFLVCNYLA